MCLNPLYFAAPGVCFKSTEEQSSRRRERTRVIKGTGNGTRVRIRETGCLRIGRESSYNEWITEEHGKAGFGLQVPTNSGIDDVVIGSPNLIFENRISEGGDSERDVRPFAFFLIELSDSVLVVKMLPRKPAKMQNASEQFVHWRHNSVALPQVLLND